MRTAVVVVLSGSRINSVILISLALNLRTWAANFLLGAPLELPYTELAR